MESDEGDEQIRSVDPEFINFILLNLYPQYVKKFKCSSVENDDKFTKVLALILGILLKSKRITWTDLSGTFGPNSAKLDNRASFCKIYIIWLKMKTKLNFIRIVLNPTNSAELWVKCLIDLHDYGQIDFFNVYYNTTVTSRIECFKRKYHTPILDLLLLISGFLHSH